MARSQYAGTPTQPPAPTLTAISGNLSSAVAGVYHFWLAYQGRGGFSLTSARAELAIAAGQGIEITIPGSALPSPNGADIRHYCLLASTTSEPATSLIVASSPGYDLDGETVLTPPFTLTLTEDEHLNLSSLTVADDASLPSDRVNGMRRSIDSRAGAIYEWNEIGNEWRVAVPQTFSGYISDMTGVNGANRSLGAIADPSDILYPEYGLSGASESVSYWLVNNESAPIPQGKRIALTLSANILGLDTDLTANPNLIGGIELRLMGYADTTTGILDTSDMIGLDEPISLTGPDTTLILPKALPVGSAAIVKVIANLSVTSTNNQIPDGTLITFTPTFFTENARPNPAAILTGNLITGDFQRRRLVPTLGLNAIALNGAGLLALPNGAGFSFYNVGEMSVVNLLANTANQLVAINVSGECLVVDVLPDFAALRCFVSTTNGQGKGTAWSAPVTLSNAVYLQVVVTYPTTIRTDYDDVVAGSPDGTFNATFVRVYVRPVGGGNADYWDYPVTPNQPSDTFLVGALAGTDSGSDTLPTPSSDRFGLYEPHLDDLALSTPAGSSTFTSGDYEIAIAYRYENTITALDHRQISGCIAEAEGTFADLFALLRYYGPPVESLWDLRSLEFSDRASDKEFFCGEAGNAYRWKPNATETQDADYLFSTTTTSGPSSGQIRLNNADPALATELYLHETDRNGTAIAGLLDEITENQQVRLQSVSSRATHATYTVSGAIVDNGSDRTIPITYREHSGALTNGEPIVFHWADGSVRPFDIAYPAPGRFLKDDSDQILVLDAVPTGSVGETGDLAVIRNTAIAEYGDVLKKTSPTTWTTLLNILPYTRTTADFTQPAPSATVTISVRNSRLFPLGARVFVEGGGVYIAIAQPSPTSLELENIGDATNAAELDTISAGAQVSMAGGPGPKGDIGDEGPPGAVTAASSLKLTEGSSDISTAANEIALYNKDNRLRYRLESDGTLYDVAPTLLEENAQTGTTYTLALSDAFRAVTLDNASPITLTVPTQAAVAFPIGTQILVGRKGSGAVDITPDTGVTLNGANTAYPISAQWAIATLWKIGTDAWWIIGG